MPEVAEQVAEPIVLPNPFVESTWKTDAPKAVEQPKIDPAIDEKDKKIKPEDTSVKPNDPDKIPKATPEPIQDKPKVEEKLTEPFAFKNEASKKYFELISKGEEGEEELYNFIHEKKTLSSIEKMKPDEVIKLDLEYRNKDFDQSEINDLFSERYPTPEAPKQGEDETDEDFSSRTEKYTKQVQKLEKQIARDAKTAKSELLKLQQEIVLPDIPKQEPKAAAPTQEELDRYEKGRQDFAKSLNDGLEKFNGYNTVFKDEEVEIPVNYAISKEEKESIKPVVESLYSDWSYFEKRWLNPDKSINVDAMSQDIHLLENRDKIFSKFVSEAGQKRHAEDIKAIKNVDFTGTKRSGTTELSDKEKQDAMAKHFFSS